MLAYTYRCRFLTGQLHTLFGQIGEAKLNQKESLHTDPKVPPQKCPQCGHSDFVKLESESGGFFSVMTILSFIFDLFNSRPTRSMGLESLNKQRPGWMCE